LRSSLLLSFVLKSSGFEFGIIQDFSCTVEGAGGQEACDASTAQDQSQCVWCSFQSFGICVSETQAAAMKKAIPGLECDDDQNDDDSPKADDDGIPMDDDSPEEYWQCLKGYTDHDDCTAAGCEWCSTKAGYGICLSKKAAAKVDKYDWFECTSVLEVNPFEIVNDPFDATCLQVSLQGDEATCEETTGVDGNPCEWCNVASANLCLDSEQAAIVKQLGGDCSTGVKDPYDPSCLMASLSGDEATCESTVDAEGNACEWCSVNSVNLCLNGEQAQIAEQLGGECSSGRGMEDLLDSTCLQVSIQGDEAACNAAVDAEGQICEWCSVASINLCLTNDQADAVELLGGDCSAGLDDPYDTSCLQASVAGDEGTCESTVDEEGNPCEWCTVASVGLCLTSEQAQAAQLLGGTCNSMEWLSSTK